MLEIRDLEMEFFSPLGRALALRGVNLELSAGECLGVVGESGSGKSLTARAIMQLEKPSKGSILFEGESLLSKSEEQMQKIRGAKIAMIFQDPMSSLNPTKRVIHQIEEGLLWHELMRKKEARERAESLLERVGIDPSRGSNYPHEFSGGMRQRVMIAIALACQPKLLIADEPTTALDVTVQREILDLLRELQEEQQMALLLITHDFGVVAHACDRVAVMYAGRVVEEGAVKELLQTPSHPYTEALLGALPRKNMKREERLPSIRGSAPELYRKIEGCAFAPRCPYTMQGCLKESPPFYEKKAACWKLAPEYPR